MTKFTRYTVNIERQRFHKESIWKKFKIGSISIRMVIFGLIILVGLVYLVQINRVSTSGFKLKELSQKAEELRLTNKKLELQAEELQSLKNIMAASADLKLVGVSKVDYVILPPAAVALGK